ncbi:hypothetical protein EON62_06245, partial [archaeon]
MHRRDETPPEEFDPTIYIPDADVREIVLEGEVRLFSVTGQGESLRALLLNILAAQRDRLLLKSLEGGMSSSPTMNVTPPLLSKTSPTLSPVSSSPAAAARAMPAPTLG